MIRIASFRLKFKEFSDEAANPDSDIQISFDEAKLIMGDEAKWLEFYDLAFGYLVAHLYVLNRSTETGASEGNFPTKLQTVGETTIVTAIKDQDIDISQLYTTSYGRSYKKFVRIVFTGIYGV